MAQILVVRNGPSLVVSQVRSVMTQIGGSNLTFEFPFAPNRISFDSVGSEYAEIARPGDFSLIDRRGPTLMRSSFEFRVADRVSGGRTPIDETLRLLRRMAYEDTPVRFGGMAGFLVADDSKLVEATSAMLFRIVDMSMTVVRLTDGNVPSQVDVRITVSEDRNPQVAIVALPRIVYQEEPPKVTKTPKRSNKSNTTKPKVTDEWTDNYNGAGGWYYGRMRP